MVDQRGVIAGGGDNVLAVDLYFVATGDDQGAAIVRPQLGEIGQGFDEGAVEEVTAVVELVEFELFNELAGLISCKTK